MQRILSFNDFYKLAMDSFPYKTPNSQQYEIINAILKLGEQQALLIEAATGSGKTIASLSAMLAKSSQDQRIIVFVRTLSQIEPILREWARLIQGFEGIKNNIEGYTRVLPMIGKAKLCKQLPILKDNLGLNDQSVQMLCQSLPCKLFPKYAFYNPTVQINEMGLINKINMSLAGQVKSGVPSLDKIYEIYSKIPSCGYYDQRKLLKHAKIVVATYAYMKQPLLKTLIREMNTDLSKCLILVDEAHNMVQTQRSKITKENVYFVQRVIGQNNLLDQILSNMKYKRKIHPDVLGEEEEWDYLKRMLTESTRDLRERLNTTIVELSDPNVISVASFIQARHLGNLITGKDQIEIVQSTPEAVLVELHEAAMQIYQSGTLSPLDEYKRLFGLHYAKTLKTMPATTENQFRCYLYYKGMTSKFSKRSPKMFDQIVKTILELVPLSPRHVLIICPSYDYKEEISSRLRSFYPHLYDEQRGAKLEDLNNLLRQGKEQKVLVGVSNGKISEGTEIVIGGKSMISLVIFAGLPVTPPSDDDVVIKRAIARASRDHTAGYRFQRSIPLSRSIRQAYGRTIRSIDDRGALVILDWRAEDLLKKELRLMKYRRPEDLKRDLLKFFHNYQSVEQIFSST